MALRWGADCGVSQSGATNPTCQGTGASTRDTNTVGTSLLSAVLKSHAEGVEIKYEVKTSSLVRLPHI